MNRIETVSPELRFLIDKVQNTSELNEFSLTGGTNLALRFDHRISEDIDLFTNKKLGVKKLKDIKYQLMNSFSKFKPYVRLINDDSNQKVWIRMMVEMNNTPIRFDIVQNVPFMYLPKQVNGIKMAHVKDIALMKIDSAIRRGALKDMYDLNYITDHIIPLVDLCELFRKRQKKFGSNINTFTANQSWNSVDFFEALADVREQFNPKNLRRAVTPQKGFPDIITAYKQWKQKVDTYVQSTKKDIN